MANFFISGIIPNSFRKMRKKKQNRKEKTHHKDSNHENRKIEVKVITAVW